MPFIDEHGRVFGKVNVVDAAALAVVCLLIPLAYGAYLLFKPVRPRLLAIEPVRVEAGTPGVNVLGQHLRPGLRLMVGPFGTRFLVADVEHGVMEMPSMPSVPAGTYDVVLFDEDQEIERLPGGLTVFVPPPKVVAPVSVAELVAVGAFDALRADQAQTLWKTVQATKTMRSTDASSGKEPRPASSWSLLAISPPEPNVEFMRPQDVALSDGYYQVRAVLKFGCVFGQLQCAAFDVALAPNVSVGVPVDAGGTRALFRIDELHPVYTRAVDVTLRSYLTAEELAMVRGEIASRTRTLVTDSLEPSFESVEVLAEAPNKEFIVNVRVRVPVANAATGWVHRNRILRTAEGFVAGRGAHQVAGRITQIGTARPLPLR